MQNQVSLTFQPRLLGSVRGQQRLWRRGDWLDLEHIESSPRETPALERELDRLETYNLPPSCVDEERSRLEE